MKRIALFITLFICASLQASIPTPKAVTSFYDSMKKLSEVDNSKEAEKIIQYMCTLEYSKQHGSASGVGLRNDFQSFSYDEHSSTHYDESISFEIYLNRLEEYIYTDKVMTVGRINVIRNDYYGEAIDFSSGKLTNQKTMVKTIVEKTYTINHQTISFVDTLLTDIPTNTIFKFYNIEVLDDKDIKDLKRQAARYYFLGQYEDAYRCFEKILSINANEGESLYRLGLMTYYGKGCDKSHKKGKEYMIRASESDVSYGFKDKAEIVLHNWKYWGSLM